MLHVLFLTVAALLMVSGCSSPRPASLAGGKSHFTSYGTNKIHYVTAGQGRQTVVFVHCWAGNCGFWREQVPALADKARLILVELPGHGQSDKPHTDYTMDFLAGAVLAVMADARVDRATLVGHSMGTPVICRVYKQAPEKVAALVAVDGTLRRPHMTFEQCNQYVEQLRSPDYRENVNKFIATFFPVPGTEALRDEVLAEMFNTPQFVMADAMQGMFGLDQPDWDLKQVAVPVMCINASNPQWNAEYENYVRSLSPMTDYRVLEGVGHWLMLEKPAEFNAILTGMLQEFELVAK
jgi:pimeloyl-ACP methyl ester carboxylesterase